MDIVVKEVRHGTQDYEQEIALRDKILRKPLGLKLAKEDLDREVEDIHLGAYIEGKLIGCLVLTPTGNSKIKMRQVAIDESAQGFGIGRRLVDASEARAKELGFLEMELNARDTAIPFYLKLGYAVVGEPFTEVTISHRKMHKFL